MNSQIKYNILHIDDHEIFRDSLSQLIALETDYHIKYQLGSTKKALEVIAAENIHILVLDISIDSTDICTFIKRVKSKHPNLHIVALSMHEDLYIIRNILKSGADAYISKTSPYDQLIKAFESIGTNKKYICNHASSILADSLMQAEPKPHEKLTYREFHIFSMLAQGTTLNEIGKELNLSPKTISSHKSRLMSKMSFASNADIVKYYLDNIHHA